MQLACVSVSKYEPLNCTHLPPTIDAVLVQMPDTTTGAYARSTIPPERSSSLLWESEVFETLIHLL